MNEELNIDVQCIPSSTSADCTTREGLANQDISHAADTPVHTPSVQTMKTTTEQKRKDSHRATQERLKKLSHDATDVGKAVIKNDKRSISPFAWKGSSFELLTTDAKLYFLILLLVVGIILRYTGLVDPVPFTETLRGSLSYMSFALTFVLTFYLNTSYDRFVNQGQLSKALTTSISTIVMLLRLDMKNDVKLQLKLARLINASHFLTWCDMAKAYPWNYLFARGLLTSVEVHILKSFTANNKDVLVTAWMLEEVGNWQYKKMEAGFLSMQDVLGIKNQIIDVRSKSSALKKSRSVRTPYLYTHLLWWTLMLFLSINVYYAALGEPDPDNPENINEEEIWWKIGVVIVIVVFLSLFNIALALQEPFGTSPGDIQFNDILEGTIERTRCILGVHLNPEESAAQSDMDSLQFTDACAKQNEVVGGKSPHINFLNESLPTVTYMDQSHSISEEEDGYGFPFKILMDHESELQESLLNHMSSTEPKHD